MNKPTIEVKDFIGKTIASVDASAVNVLHIVFTDGSQVSLEPGLLNASIGLYGIIQSRWPKSSG